MMRPADRRETDHEEPGHRNLGENLVAAFELIENRGGEHDGERRQQIETELGGGSVQPIVHEPALNRNIIDEVNIAHTRRI